MTIKFTAWRPARLGAVGAVAIPLLMATPAWAQEPPEAEAQRLVHLLSYVGTDYGGAVEGGAVANEAEYEEQLQLLGEAKAIAERLDRVDAAAAAVAAVAAVEGVVRAKGPEADVVRLVADGRRRLVLTFRVAEAPKGKPDPLRGQALFREQCATCHGDTGNADTPRAATLTPRPAAFASPEVGEVMSPIRAHNAVRFGIGGTAMVPFTFLSEPDRWNLAFYVAGIRHQKVAPIPAPAFSLGELATKNDGELARELRAAGAAEADVPGMLADLRVRAPYDARVEQPLAVARAKLGRARDHLDRGDGPAARAAVVDAYLDGVEPAEGPLGAADRALVVEIEARFRDLRAALERGDDAGAHAALDATLASLTKAETILARQGGASSRGKAILASGGIVLREGMEAALLLAALLSIAKQAGLDAKRRLVHAGWATALVAGAATFLASHFVVSISGASRELVEGLTAVAAAGVLFYVSYSLLAQREVARWLAFLRSQVSSRRAAVSLFGVAFLACYREAFETVLFYQALFASGVDALGVAIGALAGAVLLVGAILVYSRAGRLAPPKLFFRVSSGILYGLSVVFAGQGVAALQTAGLCSTHALPLPTFEVVGFFPTVETLAAQGLLVALALVAVVVERRRAAATTAAPA